MAQLLEKHQGKLIAVATIAAVAGLIWAEDGRNAIPDGTAAPDATLHTLGDAAEVKLTSLRGKPAVLDFYATWCGPCRKSMPDVDALAKKYEGRAHVFAVNAENEPLDLQLAFRQSLGVTLPILADGGALAATFGIQSMPTTVVLDKEGKVARVFRGIASESELSGAVDELL